MNTHQPILDTDHIPNSKNLIWTLLTALASVASHIFLVLNLSLNYIDLYKQNLSSEPLPTLPILLLDNDKINTTMNELAVALSGLSNIVVRHDGNHVFIICIKLPVFFPASWIVQLRKKTCHKIIFFYNKQPTSNIPPFPSPHPQQLLNSSVLNYYVFDFPIYN